MNTLKNILNNTILKNLNAYEVKHDNGRIFYLATRNDFENFMNIQIKKGKLSYYKFTTPAQRKAERIENILNNLVLTMAIFGIALIILITIQTYI
tara:strand:+ start:385 stop:669 length:285 start_codon:yes stop_codon:yes gene_type:complete